MPRGVPIDLIGRKFSRLIVIEKATMPNGKCGLRCLCDCGSYKNVTSSNLISGDVRSCGCLFREQPNQLRHGHARAKDHSSEYNSWCAMKGRCLDPKNRAYHHYGGRGITICERWLVFDNFLADMGQKPTKLHTIDRIEVNGNYEPTNCKWSTRKEQRLNQRKLARIEDFTIEELVAEIEKRRHDLSN